MSTSSTASRVSTATGPRAFRSTEARADRWAKLRFVLSWAAGSALVLAILPRAVDVSWHAVLPVLGSVRWPAALALSAVWFLGLVVHSFVLTAAAPSLTHRRALTLNLTESGVLLVVSDGFYTYADEKQIARLVKELPKDIDALTMARHLVEYARNAGGRDNITVVTILF